VARHALDGQPTDRERRSQHDDLVEALRRQSITIDRLPDGGEMAIDHLAIDDTRPTGVLTTHRLAIEIEHDGVGGHARRSSPGDHRTPDRADGVRRVDDGQPSLRQPLGDRPMQDPEGDARHPLVGFVA